MGLFTTLLSLARLLHEPALAADFDQWHFAARELLRGEDPYLGIGPNRPFGWPWPLMYPLPAVVLTMPLAWLSTGIGRVVFCAIGGAVFGYAVCRDGYWRLSACLGAAFLISVWRAQWSLLLTAAYFVPAAAVVLAAKPNIGLAIAAGVRSRKQLVWLAILCAVAAGGAFVLSPRWPLEWLNALRTAEYRSAPVMNPGGFLLPLALVRWRRPEARLFAVLACVPQTPSLYDLLPLFVVPRSLRGSTVLALLTHALFLTLAAQGPHPSVNDYTHRLEQLAVFFVWLPALGMILVRRNTWSDDAPVATEVAAATTFRERVATLSRTDALLLLAAAACSAFLIWVTLVTRQA